MKLRLFYLRYFRMIAFFALVIMTHTACTPLDGDIETLREKAREKLNRYKVTFNINGGNGKAPSAQIEKRGTNITLPGGGGFSKTGYVFGGWNKNADGTGYNYDAGDPFTSPVAHTVTLYARWTVAYTVIFDANGGSGAIPPGETANAGDSITLPDGDDLSKSGCVFVGWSTSAYGGVDSYDAGDSYTVTGDITLYALWQEMQASIEYVVTFNANGGTGTVPSARTVSAGFSISLPGDYGLSNSSYIFGGWNTQADGMGHNYNGGAWYTVTGNVTLYAKWNVAYTVTFNINGGSGTVPSPQTVIAGSSITLPGDYGFGLSNSDYIFGGWNTQADGMGSNYSGGASYTPAGSITLYAKWDTITVTFDLNGGSGTTPSPQTVSAGSGISLPGDYGLSNSGYTFGGWNTQADGMGHNYNGGTSYTPAATITLYAKWNVAYTVTFNLNSGSGTPPSAQTASYGWNISLPGDYGLSKTGFIFGGWNTNASGTGTNYSGGASYTVTGNVTLYAKWNDPYTVTFNTNGGSSIAGLMITTEETAATRPTNPARSNYVFDYWYTDAGLTIPYNFDAAVTSSITLYAKWISQTDITAMAGKDMVFVPGGSFEMGKNLGTVTGTGYADVMPLHMVTLSGFWMGKYEVTQEKYQEVMSNNPSSFMTGVTEGETQNKRPVERVTWYDAVEFCNKLSTSEGLEAVYTISGRTPASGYPITSATVNADFSKNGYRLPTEAQWEYAAKGGDPTAAGWVGYTYAGSDTVGSVAWYTTNSSSRTHEVGKLAANRLGIYDMSGNVNEWCWDWYGNYTAGAQTNPTGASSGSDRVVRGGGWGTSAESVRSANRSNGDPNYRNSNIGFRLARP